MTDAHDAGHPPAPPRPPQDAWAVPHTPLGQSLPLAPLSSGDGTALGTPPPPPAPPAYPVYGAAPSAPQPPSSQPPSYQPAAFGQPGAAPTAGYPSAPASAYPVSHGGYPVPGQPAYGYMAPSGRKFWGLLFLFYIPYLGWLVTIIVGLVQRSSAKQSPMPIVRENARWALNWALSYVIYQAVILALIVAIVAASPDGEPPAVIAIPGTLFFGVGVYCLVTMIRGCVISDRVVHRPALALPLFRA